MVEELMAGLVDPFFIKYMFWVPFKLFHLSSERTDIVIRPKVRPKEEREHRHLQMNNPATTSMKVNQYASGTCRIRVIARLDSWYGKAGSILDITDSEAITFNRNEPVFQLFPYVTRVFADHGLEDFDYLSTITSLSSSVENITTLLISARSW